MGYVYLVDVEYSWRHCGLSVKRASALCRQLRHVLAARSHRPRQRRAASRVDSDPRQLRTAHQDRLRGTTGDVSEFFCSVFLAVLDPRVGHTVDALSPFISVLCHSDWLLHGESCPRLDVVHPGRAWPSSCRSSNPTLNKSVDSSVGIPQFWTDPKSCGFTNSFTSDLDTPFVA